MSLEGGPSMARFIAGGLELGKKWDLVCSEKIVLSAMLCWGVFNFEGVLYY